MSPVVTLNISDDAIERAQAIAQHDGTTVEAVLTHCIEFGTTDDQATLLSNGYVYTLSRSSEVAEALSKLLYDKNNNQDQAE